MCFMRNKFSNNITSRIPENHSSSLRSWFLEQFLWSLYSIQVDPQIWNSKVPEPNSGNQSSNLGPKSQAFCNLEIFSEYFNIRSIWKLVSEFSEKLTYTNCHFLTHQTIDLIFYPFKSLPITIHHDPRISNYFFHSLETIPSTV